MPTVEDMPLRQPTLARAVLAAAVLQVLAPVMTIAGPGASPGSGSGPELLITPVGWAFSIWGVIYTLALVQAVAVVVRRGEGVPRRTQVGQLVLYVGGAVWILMAALDSSLLTALALAVMLVGAWVGVLSVARASVEPTWLRRLSLVAVGLYAGWVTAAFFLNVSTALVDLGVVAADRLGWQLVVLVVATVVLATVAAAARGNVAFVAAGAWALVGIAVTGADNATASVLAVAAIGVTVLLGTAVAVRLTHRADHRPA